MDLAYHGSTWNTGLRGERLLGGPPFHHIPRPMVQCSIEEEEEIRARLCGEKLRTKAPRGVYR